MDVLVNEIAFQRNKLGRRRLIGPADEIEGVGDAAHKGYTGGIQEGDSGVVALRIGAGYGDGAVVCAGKGFGNCCTVGALEDGAVVGDAKSIHALEYPSCTG